MNDELQKLVAELRHPVQRNERYYEPLCARAADEIERLVAGVALPRSDASVEPVGWQYRNEISKAIALGINGNKHPISITDDVLALLAAAPRPDASAESRVTLDEIEAAMDRVLERHGFHTAPPDTSAGLIEAAEWHEQQAAAYREQARKSEAVRNMEACVAYDRKRAWHQQSAKYIRARAADRSGK